MGASLLACFCRALSLTCLTCLPRAFLCLLGTCFCLCSLSVLPDTHIRAPFALSLSDPTEKRSKSVVGVTAPLPKSAPPRWNGCISLSLYMNPYATLRHTSWPLPLPHIYAFCLVAPPLTLHPFLKFAHIRYIQVSSTLIHPNQPIRLAKTWASSPPPRARRQGAPTPPPPPPPPLPPRRLLRPV